jgi:hypothetical protein
MRCTVSFILWLPVPSEMAARLCIGPMSLPDAKNPSLPLTCLAATCMQMATRFYGSSQVLRPALVIAGSHYCVGVILLPGHCYHFPIKRGCAELCVVSPRQRERGGIIVAGKVVHLKCAGCTDTLE